MDQNKLLKINAAKKKLRDFQMAKTDCNEELQTAVEESKANNDLVQLLVQEKSKLTDDLQKQELIEKELRSENEELNNRLRASRHRVKELETQNLGNQQQQAADIANENEYKCRIELMELKKLSQEEKAELSYHLNQQKIEYDLLRKNFDVLNKELLLTRVKVDQLSEDSVADNQDDNEAKIKQYQINKLISTNEQLNKDRDSINMFVTHLKNEYEELKIVSDAKTDREQNLIQHIQQLEKQIQMQIQKQQTMAENNASLDDSKEVNTLKTKLCDLSECNNKLQNSIKTLELEKQSVTEELNLQYSECNRLNILVEENQLNRPDLSKLAADIESDKLAASIALVQNTDLKKQIHEIEQAFVTVSNDKFDLANKLQSEMHLCKEMRNNYLNMENQLSAIKETLGLKDAEMIRLSHENSALEKTIIQQNIELDHLRHYESKRIGDESIIEKELENSNKLVKALTNKMQILEDQVKDDKNEKLTKTDAESINAQKQLIDEIETLRMEKEELLNLLRVGKNERETIKNVKTSTNTISNAKTESLSNTDEWTIVNGQDLETKSNNTVSIATEEALEKLQNRFRRTMQEVADLTDEKQRLEHLVLQLQFETETIGEYITLYQNQRRLLKQKNYERDIQLKKLAADRDEMNNKLIQLNNLITKYVIQRDPAPIPSLEYLSSDSTEHSGNASVIIHKHDLAIKQETAGRIFEILSEMKTKNTNSVELNVCAHACSCCLGKLETV